MSKRLLAAAALIALVTAGGLFLVNQKTPVPLVQGSSLSGQLIDTQA